MLGEGGPPTQQRLYYQGNQTKLLRIVGSSENYPAVVHVDVDAGRFFTQSELRHRRAVVVLGQTPYQALFPYTDPIGKAVRIGTARYTVIGVMEAQPSPGGFNAGQDDLAVIPHTTYQKQFGIRAFRWNRGVMRSVMIAAVPREGVPRAAAMREIEQIMRIRHGLRLDEENDFELITQDAALALWDQVSQVTFLALIVISSIALLVGGIGVMAVMTISVTERTSEIGMRKAVGARRREILWQFLMEAVFLTSAGGVLGIVFGSGIGVTVHFIFGFPVSLPWWAFALGIGFSASVASSSAPSRRSRHLAWTQSKPCVTSKIGQLTLQSRWSGPAQPLRIPCRSRYDLDPLAGGHLRCSAATLNRLVPVPSAAVTLKTDGHILRGVDGL